jgi:hypothetical protein
MTTAPISLQGHRPDLFTVKRGAILKALLDRKGQWIPSYELSRIALQCGARVKECREAGFIIENRTERAGRKVHGSFRLVAEPGETPSLFREELHA